MQAEPHAKHVVAEPQRRNGDIAHIKIGVGKRLHAALRQAVFYKIGRHPFVRVHAHGGIFARQHRQPRDMVAVAVRYEHRHVLAIAAQHLHRLFDTPRRNARVYQ